MMFPSFLFFDLHLPTLYTLRLSQDLPFHHAHGYLVQATAQQPA
jgi:hypothetical protein